MTGTGLSVVSQNDSVSYNRSVNVINVHQKDNVNKLENALINANRNNDILQEALSTVIRTINNCKKQIFINDSLIVNWNRTAPYTYNVELLR
jgi:hypothetical protein